ncbi:PepSY-associated TM helix domain-containing protein [Singulisphaera acidiphila]|uniref:Putative iron-regulated membrane protein n=1 Tax=Singulisphaera acidiphila (strain ATCC BAA-1392 / DSM 18658 / VKM B-2454 / MOB10) TaxID=886293 RepID=L0DRR8_SINAD|nr:PepSY-associated TM helix domain-containing protein [Singulisphaera acidiphila]AGA31081.1 putative iron-regulated membrane protein [Singulisphaera acidiphila DSM 18658]
MHRWVALAVGLFVFLVSLTGAALVFENQIDRVLNSRLFYVKPQGERLPLQQLLERVRSTYPENRVTSVRLAEGAGLSYQFQLSKRITVYVEPYTGQILGTRSMEQWEVGLARRLHLLHTRLMAGQTGERIVGVISFLTAFLVVTGLILWWPACILTFRRRGSWKRWNSDAHYALGFYTAPIALVMAVSGVIIAFGDFADPLIDRLNAEPPPARPTRVASTSNDRPISLDEASRIARETLPGAALVLLAFPEGARPIVAQMKYPEDRTPAGRSRVFLNPYSGELLLVESARQAGLGTQLHNLKRSLHTGDIFGWPTRILYLIASLILALLWVTGMFMWWPAFRARRKNRLAQRATVRETIGERGH